MNSASKKQTDNSLLGCTIAQPGELPQAVALAESFQHFHPDSEFFVLVPHQTEVKAVVSGIVQLGLEDLGLQDGEEWRLPMLYGIETLTNGLQPVLLQTLLRKGANRVAYFERST